MFGILMGLWRISVGEEKKKKKRYYVYESVGEIGRKMGVKNFAWCVKERKERKKYRKETHEKKNCERKEKWEERKIQKQGMCKMWRK